MTSWCSRSVPRCLWRHEAGWREVRRVDPPDTTDPAGRQVAALDHPANGRRVDRKPPRGLIDCAECVAHGSSLEVDDLAIERECRGDEPLGGGPRLIIGERLAPLYPGLLEDSGDLSGRRV